ncbi:hypothetical protein PPL_00216 [Heterostelium album PN500]|uniref:TPR-like protein n=1 Tax=Heterostelium pallidum (strain ATCC 26659 / Pp 5 / PN500) TaxID=670386 RepID=D3AVV1_HETP5|nr:hypothetical protein PPL_00216 [Heterostelium album PN500]EFA86424.1 hypothetical protein PPL_00216 [Heterostelium album PN500]|eukprot:XP_020438529.1 hypothetical protein PPL_00216 [Heterostelium album PN500]
MSSLGRSKAAMMQKNRNKKAAAQQQQQPKKKLSLEELIAKADDYAQEFKLDLALKYYIEALNQSPKNSNIMDSISEVLLEMGDTETAKQYIVASIQANPNDNAAKYMNYGQLTGGQEAIKSYTKGIELMESELNDKIKKNSSNNNNNSNNNISKVSNKNNKNNNNVVPIKVSNQNNNKNNKNKKTKDGRLVEDKKYDISDDEEDMEDDDEHQEEELSEEEESILILKDQICSALCSLSELYLTDECFDDNAEIECEKHILRAIEYAPTSPEPYSMMASMRISQQKNEEALRCLQHSYSLWSELTIDKRPSLEYRFDVSRLFIELNQNRTAVDILETLVYEQDNIAEIWHTLSIVYQSLNEPRSALECIEVASQLLAISNDQDEKFQKDVNDILIKLQHEVSLLPEEEEEGEDDDEQMED